MNKLDLGATKGKADSLSHAFFIHIHAIYITIQHLFPLIRKYTIGFHL